MTPFLLVLGACGGEGVTDAVTDPVETPPVAEAAPHDGVDFDTVEGCATCHSAAVEEWSESMHARAHADRDPLFRAMRELRMRVQGDAVGEKCARCHNPLDPSSPDSAAGKLGVACGACHSADGTTVDVADGRSICLTCHGAAHNPSGVATCTTGTENEARGGPACVACHMPLKDGRRAHTFSGPHRAWLQDDSSLLRQALNVVVEPVEGGVEVSVANLTGHGFPSGFPGRVASVRLTDGKWTTAPPELLFRKVYTDAAGKPTLPPFAATLSHDGRLEPGETRRVTVPLPDGTGPVRAELVYALLPPPAVEALGVGTLPESTPVVVPLWPVTP